MTRDSWLSTHPYLQPVSDLETLVDATVGEVVPTSAFAPRWEEYLPDFSAGVPLLLSSTVAVDPVPLGTGLIEVTRKLASHSLPLGLENRMRPLHSDLSNADPRSTIAWLSDRTVIRSDQGHLLHYLGWAALARYLRPLVYEFSRWRNEEHWLRSYCPTCGAPPAMAHLASADFGSLRVFSCAYCKSRWQFRRTGCPFCDNNDDHRMRVLAIEDECGLRIDCCEECGGYIKTYRSEHVEEFLLSEWATLHLDIIARDRGLKRLASSLYEV